jgi:hypothetical protein
MFTVQVVFWVGLIWFTHFGPFHFYRGETILKQLLKAPETQLDSAETNRKHRNKPKHLKPSY